MPIMLNKGAFSVLALCAFNIQQPTLWAGFNLLGRTCENTTRETRYSLHSGLTMEQYKQSNTWGKTSVSQFSCSVMSNSLRPHGSQNAGLPRPSPTFRSLLKLMSIESLMPSNHLILYPALLLLPSIFPSIRVFFNESILHIRWPKYWSITFNISPSNEHSGLIFRIDCFDLLAVQGTLKSLLQHHSSKASILRRSAFFMVQLSHHKTIALTRRTFVGKVMSLLFKMLSRLVIAFLPRSKCLLISWLQSPLAVILKPKKIKSAALSSFSLFAMKWWHQMP